VSDELMELPEGWDWTSFEELAEMIPNALKAGPFGSALKKSFYVPNGYKIYGQEQVINEDPHFGNYYIDETRYEELKSCAVKPGDILISLVGTIGKVLILPEGIEPGIINPRLVKLSLDRILVNNEYVKKYLESPSVRDYLSKLSHGGTMDILNLSILKTLKISLPPLNEQKRIVAEIEALRERSQKARSALSAIPELCDKFRQSFLAAAFRGDLTADWREQNSDVEPASVLLERIRQKDSNTYKELQERDLPETWKWVKFQDVADIQSNLVDPASYLDSPHIAPNHIVSSTGELLEFTTVSADKVTSSKHLFEPGQIIYSKIRPYLAKAVLINFSGLCSADMYPIKSRINSAFLHQWMICPEFTELASGQQGRTVLPKINQAALNQLPVPVPPLAEQIEIIRQLQSNLSLIATITSQIEKTTYEIDFLDRSILAKAFRGELVEQDLNDEPASVLLERIRVDREQRAQEKTKRKRTVKTDSV